MGIDDASMIGQSQVTRNLISDTKQESMLTRRIDELKMKIQSTR